MKQMALLRPKPQIKKTFRGYAEIVCWCGYGTTAIFPFNAYPFNTDTRPLVIIPSKTYTMIVPCPDCRDSLYVHWLGDELMETPAKP